jgi:hypothetical protein
MHVSARSYLTAGVAALSATAIAMAPVQPLSQGSAVTPALASNLAVNLAAAVTPVAPLQNIIDVIEASGANFDTLFGNWTSGLYVNGTIPSPPNTGLNGNLGYRVGGYATGVALPILSQVITNLEAYLGELSDIGGILGQIFDNLGNSLRAPFAPGVVELARALDFIPNSPYNQNVNAVPYVTIPGIGVVSQRDIGALLPLLAGEAAYASLEPIINILTTPISGVLVGAIGPIVAPVLAVVNSITNTIALLRESDFGGALTELINIPANAIGALLNGGPTLDLTGLVGLLGVTLPDSITSIGLKMGGLLSPGGVGLDALAAVATTEGLGALTIPGLPVGPIGALAGLGNYVAKSIVVPPAPVQVAAAVKAPAVEAAEVAAPAAAPDSAPEVAAVAVSEPAEAAAPVSEPAQQVADDADNTPAAPRTPRAARGVGASSSDDGAGASTPKRSARGAASRG